MPWRKRRDVVEAKKGEKSKRKVLCFVFLVKKGGTNMSRSTYIGLTRSIVLSKSEVPKEKTTFDVTKVPFGGENGS